MPDGRTDKEWEDEINILRAEKELYTEAKRDYEWLVGLLTVARLELATTMEDPCAIHILLRINDAESVKIRKRLKRLCIDNNLNIEAGWL